MVDGRLPGAQMRQKGEEHKIDYRDCTNVLGGKGTRQIEIFLQTLRY
jgi:hypothetical protein